MNTIYVIDDDINLMKMMDYRLKQEGFNVKCFSDAQKGLDEIYSNVPDLIILDVNLNNESEIEVAKEIEENESTKDVPIILITGSVDETLTKKNSKRHLLIKPYDFAELLGKIQELI